MSSRIVELPFLSPSHHFHRRIEKERSPSRVDSRSLHPAQDLGDMQIAHPFLRPLLCTSIPQVSDLLSAEHFPIVRGRKLFRGDLKIVT